MTSQPGFAARAALLGLGAATILGLAACKAPGLTAAGATPTATSASPATPVSTEHTPPAAATTLPSLASTVPTAATTIPVAATTLPKKIVTAPVKATLPIAPILVTHYYDNARTQWKLGAGASSAMEGKYWLAAAADLKASHNSAYAGSITDLQQLVTLPDAMQTPAQNAEFHHDVNALNTFFGTPGLYS